MIEFFRSSGPWDPWVATTAGERLLFKLIQHHQEWKVLDDILKNADLRLGRRFEGLSSFFVGASILHLQQRLLRLAQDIRNQVDDRWEQGEMLRAKIHDVIQLTSIEYRGDFSALVEEVLAGAEQMHKEPPSTLSRLVRRNHKEECYSCGRIFGAIYKDAPAPNGLSATVDHIWPRALGGDTIEENLLPACPSCNSAKGHIAAWQMAWIQPVVFSDADEVNGLDSLRREVKIALHVRAAMAYAHANGSTLQDAFVAIGPREPPVRIDADQGYDFFNLRTHDDIRTNVRWIPK
ncbi:HNH endonuclease [Thalassobaculum sp.]|uniref:HNH endonuclease n=1 Tax=Thalassobaculum sp. TaxID=2022740 RepID=UPI003B596B30